MGNTVFIVYCAIHPSVGCLDIRILFINEIIVKCRVREVY
jgi:hypothetical protein